MAENSIGISVGANYQFIGTGAGTAAGWRNVSELAGNGTVDFGDQPLPQLNP